MKRYILVDDLVKELNQTYGESMTELCMSPLGVENWLKEKAQYPVGLYIFHKDLPDPELNTTIQNLRIICSHQEQRTSENYW